jgi:hypothetical protein
MIRRPSPLDRWPLVLVAVALLFQYACATPPLDASPSLAPQAIFTAAYHTFAAQGLTEQALTPPTGTPPPTVLSTLSPTSTIASGGPGICDNASYVSDVTIPDGTVIPAGGKFVKTWLLQNVGACNWTTGYSLAFQSGDQMGGMNAAVSGLVPSGGQSELSVNLTAPASAGTYTGQWQMRNAQGQPFGSVITVVINVGAPSECRKSSKTTVTIAGHINLDSVIIDYGEGTTMTDSDGDYSFTVPMGWSGSVRPSKARVNPWTFEPAQRTYSDLSCDLLRENYKATPPPGV